MAPIVRTWLSPVGFNPDHGQEISVGEEIVEWQNCVVRCIWALAGYLTRFTRSAISNQLSAFSNQQSAISCQRSAFSNQQSAISNQLSAFSVQQSAVSVQRSAFSVQRMSDKNNAKTQKTLFTSNTTQKTKTAKNSAKTRYNAKQQKQQNAKTNKNKVDNFEMFVFVFACIAV